MFESEVLVLLRRFYCVSLLAIVLFRRDLPLLAVVVAVTSTVVAWKLSHRKVSSKFEYVRRAGEQRGN